MSFSFHILKSCAFEQIVNIVLTILFFVMIILAKEKIGPMTLCSPDFQPDMMAWDFIYKLRKIKTSTQFPFPFLHSNRHINKVSICYNQHFKTFHLAGPLIISYITVILTICCIYSYCFPPSTGSVDYFHLTDGRFQCSSWS